MKLTKNLLMDRCGLTADDAKNFLLLNEKLGALKDNQINSVNARSLHETLNIKKQFTDWIKDQIHILQLKRGRDYAVLLPEELNRSGGRPTEEYVVSLDVSKHIAMMSQTDMGYKIREYFILAEKTLKQLLDWEENRARTKLTFPKMSTALKESREDQGKETEFYHYSTEADLLNRIILGMTSKQYKLLHNLNSDEALRDRLNEMELRAFEDLQQFNVCLLSIQTPFEQRKEQLIKRYVVFKNKYFKDLAKLRGKE